MNPSAINNILQLSEIVELILINTHLSREIGANATASLARRDMTKGQKAVVVAKSNNLLDYGRKAELARVAGIHPQRISEALTVLKYAPGLADDVLAKKLRLDQAVIEARRLRVQSETNVEQWGRIRAEAPDLVSSLRRRLPPTHICERGVQLAQPLGFPLLNRKSTDHVRGVEGPEGIGHHARLFGEDAGKWIVSLRKFRSDRPEGIGHFAQARDGRRVELAWRGCW
jgi:hypothetical protein